ncbi:MAG TPA: ribonuclease P protein component [Negativicutes bacterium]|nr:ribonuclease P protein component [Negativicutes bacterium]
MLPKENRLTKENDFDAVFKNGKSARLAIISGKSSANSLGRPRFGFVVSKKISTKAALRNKVKRRLRDAVAKNVPQIKKGGDVVIIALPGIEKKGFFEIEKEVGVLFKKLGIN